MSDGRLLTCTVCGQPVRVFEAPPLWIDPRRYVCGDVDRHIGPTQLELDTGPTREETPCYDPDIADIRF